MSGWPTESTATVYNRKTSVVNMTKINQIPGGSAELQTEYVAVIKANVHRIHATAVSRHSLVRNKHSEQFKIYPE